MARVRWYPFLHLRTSHFLLVSSLVVGAIGAAGVVQALYQWNGLSGIVAALVLAGLFTAGFASHIDKLQIVSEDVRSQTTYVAAHRVADDVILVNDAASFGFAYYWPHDAISTKADDSGQGFRARVRGLGALYVPRGRTDGVALKALREALDHWRTGGPGNRLFIIRSHVIGAEVTAWSHAFAALDVHPRSIAVGSEVLLVIGPS